MHIFLDERPAPAFLERAKRQGMFVVPTLTVCEGIVGPGGGAALAKDERIAPYLEPAQARC